MSTSSLENFKIGDVVTRKISGPSITDPVTVTSTNSYLNDIDKFYYKIIETIPYYVKAHLLAGNLKHTYMAQDVWIKIDDLRIVRRPKYL